MYGYIYKITNLATNRIYVGKHKYDKPELDDKYICSGILIRRSIKKYGISNFSRELIDTADSLHELNEKEVYYIKLFNCMSPNGYNLTCGGDGISNPSDEIREKMRYWKGKTMSEESNFKRSASLKGRHHSEDWVEKIRKSNTGISPAQQTIDASRTRHINTSWYNNGIEEHMFFDTDIPDGYVKGRLKNPFPSCAGIKKSKTTREKIGNQIRGSVWYNNGEIEMMLKNASEVPEGFIKGRLKHTS